MRDVDNAGPSGPGISGLGLGSIAVLCNHYPRMIPLCFGLVTYEVFLHRREIT